MRFHVPTARSIAVKKSNNRKDDLFLAMPSRDVYFRNHLDQNSIKPCTVRGRCNKKLKTCKFLLKILLIFWGKYNGIGIISLKSIHLHKTGFCSQHSGYDWSHCQLLEENLWSVWGLRLHKTILGKIYGKRNVQQERKRENARLSVCSMCICVTVT